MNRILRLSLVGGLGGIALAGAVGAGALLTRPEPPAAQRPDAVRIGGHFELTGEDGLRFSTSDLGGRPFAVFFGFTRCPDVCPTTMLEMATLLGDLGEAGGDLPVLFVSVDPARDTPDLLAAYTDSFHPGIVGLGGTEAEVAAVAAAYLAFHRKVPTGPGPEDYTMDHTASVYLMGGDADLVATIAFGEDRETALAKLRRLVGA